MPFAFIDFEASGLGARSWPIEVGWTFEDGAGESFLISPSPEWPLDAWDSKAERLHGISPKMLSDRGLGASAACGRLDTALKGFDVYSDAPDWDWFWLMRLFAAAGRKPEIRILDFARAMPPLSGLEKSAVLAEADRRAPRRHRAGEDARHLQTIWRIAHPE